MALLHRVLMALLRRLIRRIRGLIPAEEADLPYRERVELEADTEHKRPAGRKGGSE